MFHHNNVTDKWAGIPQSVYGLEIESRWGRDFPYQSRMVLGPTQHPTQWTPGLFPGFKAAGAWR